MSLNSKNKLVEIAKISCRELRKNSTKAERIFWDAVRNRKFLNLKFYRQYPIFYDITGKESFFIADFCCYEKRLIIELDGAIHKYKIKDDADRTRILKSLGLTVIRFSNDEIEKDFEKVMFGLKRELS